MSRLTFEQVQVLQDSCWFPVTVGPRKPGHDYEVSKADVDVLVGRGLLRLATSGSGYCATDAGVAVAEGKERQGEAAVAPRRPASVYGRMRVELDAYDEEERDDLPAFVAKLRAAAGKHGVDAELVTAIGPGGGNPVFAFSGPADRLSAYLREFCGDADVADDCMSLAVDVPE